jgi:hypothetical protein
MCRRATGLACLLAAAGCAPAPSPAHCASDATYLPGAQPRSAAGYRYHVAAGPGAEQLCVEVDLPPGPAARAWTGDPSTLPFVRDVGVVRDGAFVPAAAGQGGWLVPACGAGCRLRYRLLLGDAARALSDIDHATIGDGAIVAPPSAWLLRPRDVRAPFVLRVTPSPGESFVSGLALSPDGDGFRGDVGALDDTPYAAFGAFSVTRKRVGGGLVDVAFFNGRPAPAIETWVDRALGAVAAYYQRFPIDHAALGVRLAPGAGVYGGHTMGDGGGTVLVTVGTSTDTAKLADDWMLVHELIHVSFPDVATPWIEEGLATYLEPIVRVRAGLCDADEVWRSLVEGLPQGQPEAGDGGLDVTDTWGRRYWGGALFWFIADVEIRKRTGNARSLDDALLAVNRSGGNVSQRWDLDRVLALADAGTGAEILGPLRKRMGKAPVTVDLASVWKSLGVSQVAGKMVYDDAAPLAAVRKGILGGKPR